MKSVLKNVIRFLVVAAVVSQIVFPSAAFAQEPWDGVCVGGAENDVATIQGLECLIGNAFSVILTTIGLAGFVMFVIGAFQWLVSGNNSKGVDTARQTMTYAILGIVVALSGFIIINLISGFTGINVIKQFVIPGSDAGETWSPPDNLPNTGQEQTPI